MRLNVHGHVLALDGVYVRDGPEGALAFHALPAPTRMEVTEVAERTAARVERILRAHGRSLERIGLVEECDQLTADEPTGYYAAAAQGICVAGERAGKPTLRLVVSQGPTATRTPGRRRAGRGGENQRAREAEGRRPRPRPARAAVQVHHPVPPPRSRAPHASRGRSARTRAEEGLARRYARAGARTVRPAHSPGGRPPPRLHLLRYFGVLSSHAARRRETVPDLSPAGAPAVPAQLELPFGR